MHPVAAPLDERCNAPVLTSMLSTHDSGFQDGVHRKGKQPERDDLLSSVSEESVQEREGGRRWVVSCTLRLIPSSPELAYRLLASLPRERLVNLQRRITPLLYFDVVGVRFVHFLDHPMLIL